MDIASLLLPEFDQEMATTRKVLERIPDDKLGFKAHPKANTIGWVGAHLAEIPTWLTGTILQPSWDIHPPGGEAYKSPVLKSRKEIVELFDKNVAEARKALASTNDAELMKDWSLLSGGNVIFTMPKWGVIRTWVLNHAIHHRAFLCSYLRMNDVPIPSVYGPSGDEG